MRRRSMAAVLVAALGACGSEAILVPADYTGGYALTEVDGHEIGWYHQLVGVDCAVAFLDISRLTLTAESTFVLTLYYDYRCFGAAPRDGSGFMSVTGDDIRGFPSEIVLNGWGPDVIGGAGTDRWSLELRPAGDGNSVIVRFRGFQRGYWGDPVLRMVPVVP